MKGLRENFLKNFSCKDSINIKKILIASGMILLGVILYLISPFLSGNLASSYVLLILFIILHIGLSVYYVKKDFPKKILTEIIILFLINVAIIMIEFPECEKSHKGGPIFTCDCFGLKKEGLFMSEYIGIRTECYEYNQSLIQTKEDLKNLNDTEDRTYEIPCEEISGRRP